MKRRKSLLLLWIFVFVIGATGLTYLGARVLLLRSALALRDRGLAAAAAGDDATASDLLLQYVKRRPRDTNAIKSYIHSRQRVPMTTGQQYAETMALVKLLLQQEPGNTDDQRYLLELYVKLERGPEALDIADAILAKLPNDAQTLKLKTQALIQQHKNQDALKFAERWAAAAPEDLDAHITRLDLYAQVGRPAQSIIDDAAALRQSHPGDVKFEVLQGIAYARANDPANAVKWLQTAAGHPGLSDAIVKIIVDQLDGLAQYPQALALLQDRVNHGGGTDLQDALAGRLWELGRWKDLTATLSGLTPSDSKASPTMLAMKAMGLAKIGQAADAAAYRKALADNTRPDAQAWTMMLRQLMDGAAVDDKQLVTELRAGQTLDSDNPYLPFFLGDAESRLGELDLAVTAFTRSAQMDAHWDMPAIRLAEVLLDKGESDQAYQVARVLASRNQHDPGALITLAQAWAACIENGEAGQADSLLSMISQMQQQLPSENRTLPTIKVAILAQQGKIDQAKQAAQDAMTRTPPPPEQVFRILAMLNGQYSLGLETQCFADWQHAYGNSSSLAYMEALSQAAGGHPRDGLVLYDNLQKQSKNPGDMQWQLNHARYLDTIGDPGAKAAWTSLRDAFPKSLPVQQACVNARAVHGDWQFMQPVIDHLHALSGDGGLAWRLAQDRLMIESPRGEDDYEKGSIELTSLIERFPQLPEPHVLLAEALVHMKRFDGAAEHLATATKLDPTSVPISLRLVSLLQSMGELDQAQAELDRITGQSLPLTPQQRSDVAVLYARQGKTDRAIALLQPPGNSSSPATQPAGDADQQLLLANLYRQNHQYDAADSIARDLMRHPTLAVVQFAASLFLAEAHPADAEQAIGLLDALKLSPGVKEMVQGNYYVEARDLPEAAKDFAAATRLSPANSFAWRSLIVCQMSLGQTDAVKATLDHAIHAIPADNALAALKQHIQLLMDANAYSSLRPVVLAFMENPLGSDPAVELMTLVVAERRANKLDELAGRLQQLAQAHPNDLDALLQLAQCYFDEGKSADALSVAQRAMAAFPTNPAPAEAAVQICNLSGHWPEMESAAENWKDRSSDAAEAADTDAANAENHLQNYSAALSRLQPYLPAAKADMEHHAALLSAYAIASIGAGDTTSAADVLWPLAQKSPAGREQWTQIAAGLLPAADAVQWLDRVSAIIPAPMLLERCGVAGAYDILGRRVNDPALIAKSLALLEEIAKDPKADALVFLAAGSEAERSKKLTQAESFYRRAIALDPAVWVAQNNLAMLIVSQGGDMKEALAAAQAAVKAQPHSAEIYDTLAEVQSKSGDPKAAAQTMQVAIQLEPANLMWRVRLAKYLMDAGNVTDASQAIAAIDANFPDLSAQAQDLQQQLADIRKQIHGKGT